MPREAPRDPPPLAPDDAGALDRRRWQEAGDPRRGEPVLPSHVAQMRAARFVGHLAKPVDDQVLPEALRRAVDCGAAG